VTRSAAEVGNQTNRLSATEADRRARAAKQIAAVFGVRRMARDAADEALLLDALGLTRVAEVIGTRGGGVR
jgi:hypothetical protein